jgi:hypothetical protein
MTTLYNMEGCHAGFTVMDDATGKAVEHWSWVDDVALEYAYFDGSYFWGASVVLQMTRTAKVSRVQVNYATREIHVNELPMPQTGIQVRELHACAECCQPDACRRIHFCAAWKCNFGEAKQP